MSRIRILAAMLGLTALAATAPDLGAQELREGMTVTAKTIVPAYSTPPEGVFYKKGELIDSVRTGDKFLVKETREVGTLSHRRLYLRVELPASRERQAQDGWVYAGPVGSRASNFQISEGKPSGSK